MAYPWVHFSAEAESGFAPLWVEGTHWARLRLLGILPLGRQAIVISMHRQPGYFQLRDAGYSRWITRWDQYITIKATAGGIRYCDWVKISAASWRTPVIWLFAQWFFRHWQRRLRKLAARNFARLP